MEENHLIGVVTMNACPYEQARLKAGAMVRKSNKTEFITIRHTALGLEAEADSNGIQRSLYFNGNRQGVALIEIACKQMEGSRLLDLMSQISG